MFFKLGDYSSKMNQSFWNFRTAVHKFLDNANWFDETNMTIEFTVRNTLIESIVLIQIIFWLLRNEIIHHEWLVDN